MVKTEQGKEEARNVVVILMVDSDQGVKGRVDPFDLLLARRRPVFTVESVVAQHPLSVSILLGSAPLMFCITQDQ
jgi:hypothetical protein